MDNIKGLMKKVTNSDVVQMASKTISGNNANVKFMRKELEEKMDEKIKIYGYIGMETYDLIKANKIQFPELNVYAKKIDEINQAMQEIEEMIRQEENKNKAIGRCSCGYMLKAQDRFCPNCGRGSLGPGMGPGMVPGVGPGVALGMGPGAGQVKVCVCGVQMEMNSQMCPVCGRSMGNPFVGQGEMMMPQIENKEPVQQIMVECICGAKVPMGQGMCFECGRKMK